MANVVELNSLLLVFIICTRRRNFYFMIAVGTYSNYFKSKMVFQVRC